MHIYKNAAGTAGSLFILDDNTSSSSLNITKRGVTKHVNKRKNNAPLKKNQRNETNHVKVIVRLIFKHKLKLFLHNIIQFLAICIIKYTLYIYN
jgi:hypothetical protein